MTPKKTRLCFKMYAYKTCIPVPDLINAATTSSKLTRSFYTRTLTRCLVHTSSNVSDASDPLST